MTVVVDASAVVAALVGDPTTASWANTELRREGLAAPHLMPVEAVNILRRRMLDGSISADAAAAANDELLQLAVELFPYEPHGRRVWELRNNLTAYDAWYVAIAESLGVPLVTIDGRLARASGARCEFRLPPTARTP